MRIFINCACRTLDFYGKKVHGAKCDQSCPYLTTKDRYTMPKRCGKPLKRMGLCSIHAVAKERLVKRQVLRKATV